MRQEVAIIGGGAKAAAIAAKAAALRAARRADIHVTIFERHAIGAHWDGGHGYTDGTQPLCTPAERDLGFPYDCDSYGDSVAEHMQSEYSWMAHLVRGGSTRYARWIDGGTRRPSHGDFAAYLRDAIARSGADIRIGAVTALRRTGSWAVHYTEASNGAAVQVKGFDGVVVTSPGPQKGVGTLVDHRYFDGATFWQHLADVRAIAEGGGRIVILGSGGTAAAIAAWFVTAGFRNAEIRMVAGQPTFFTRVSNLFENRIFSDDALWQMMGTQQRLEFNDRLTRGAVWDAVTATLERAENLAFHVGQARDVRLGDDPGDGTEPELVVEIAGSGTDLPAAMVINAIGFDAWWFTQLLTSRQKSVIDGARAALVAGMGYDLSLPVAGLSGLHAPLLSGNVGPGFTSLMVLGAMADRILKPYCDRSAT
ncbi:MAG: SidA/IucD/PvdA family monooxygenase [Sphingobium sp.]|nr:SidA/IucD/PvdA family monooxygenase [Sphingobium sp.]MBP9159129.1 SidA/IucD/PvdA family monooxygenase [Sphingobium sp.]